MNIDFRAFAEAHGLIVDTIVQGRWVRTKTVDKPRHRNGAYKLLGDVGFVQNHATMQEVAVWKSGKPIDEVERKRQERDLRIMRAADARNRAQALRKMRAHWASLSPFVGEHLYIVRKQLSMMGCKGLRLDGDLLTIPIYRCGDLISLQTITPDGGKKYRYLCSIKGGSFVLRRPRSIVTCLVEGFATGLAVYQALPQANVIVCFDAGNMVEVARNLQVTGMCVVCADNDWKTASRQGTNPGIEWATAAAKAIGCGIAYPEGIWGSDWADALVEWGEDGPGRLRVQIMRGAKPIFRR